MKSFRNTLWVLMKASGAAAVMVALASTAGATIMTGSLPISVLPDGKDANVGDTFPTVGPTPLADFITPSFSIAGVTWGGKFETKVLREASGTIDFMYTITPTTSNKFLDELHFTGFAGYTTSVAVMNTGGANPAEEHAVRNTPDEVDFHFHGQLGLGQSATFYIATNATSFNPLGAGAANIFIEDTTSPTGNGDEVDGDKGGDDVTTASPLLAFAPAGPVGGGGVPLPASFFPGLATALALGFGMRKLKLMNG